MKEDKEALRKIGLKVGAVATTRYALVSLHTSERTKPLPLVQPTLT